MRVIKLGLISVVFFGIFLTLLSFLFPSHIRLSKAIDIRADRDTIIAILSDVAGWERWQARADSFDLVMNGADAQRKNEKTGKMETVMQINASDSSVTTKNFGAYRKHGVSGWNIIPGGTPNTFTVQWYMDFHLRWYPWEKFSGLLLEKRYGPAMEEGLSRLKALLEK